MTPDTATLTGPIALDHLHSFITKVVDANTDSEAAVASLSDIFNVRVTDLQYPLKYIVLSPAGYQVFIRSPYVAALTPACDEPTLRKGYLGSFLGGQLLTDVFTLFPPTVPIPGNRYKPGKDVYVVATDTKGNLGIVESFQIKT